MVARPRSAAQREASRRFMETHAPDTQIYGEGAIFVDSDLDGKLIAFEPLAIALSYRYSFYVQDGENKGELCHAGVLVAKRPGVGFTLGAEWSWLAGDLRVIG